MAQYSKLSKGIGIVKNDTSLSYRVHFKVNSKPVNKILKLPVSPKNNREAIKLKSLIDHYADSLDIVSINNLIKIPFPLIKDPDLIKNLLDQWLDDIKENLPDSYKAYKRDYDQCVNKLGDYSIQELSDNPQPYFDWIESMSGLTYKTINNRVRPLRQIAIKALIKKRISNNPFEVKVSNIVRAKKSIRKIDPYSEDEIWLIINKARSQGDNNAANYIQANFYNGLRPEEMMGQEWPDMDFRKRNFKVQRAIAERRLKSVKTKGSERTVNMNDLCLEAYQRQRELTGLRNERIWQNNWKEDLIDYETINNWLKKYCKLLNIRYRSSKQLRKSYASNRLSQSKSIQEVYDIAASMGHRGKGGNVDITTLLKDYTDYMPKEENNSTFGMKIYAKSELSK